MGNHSHEPLILSADRVVVGDGSPALVNAFVRICDGKIDAVGRKEELGSSVEHARHLEYPGATILPGLIDCHTHLVLPGDGGIPFANIQHESDEVILLRAAHNARIALERGVTTLVDLGARRTVTFSLREGIEKGYVVGPRLILCGRPITTTGGHCWYFQGEADGVEEIRKLVRELVKQGADVIKVMTTGGGTAGTDAYRAYFTVPELQAAVDEAHRAGKPAVAHCTALEGIKNALEAGFDMLAHATFYLRDGTYQLDPEVAERIVASGSYVNPTMHVTRTRIWGFKQRHPNMNDQDRAELAKIQSYYDAKVDANGKLRTMGAKLVAGSDAGWADYKFGDFNLEIEALTDAGLSPMEAIASATSLAAECFGLSNTTGSIEAGKDADLLVVRGDPIVDLTSLNNVRAVFKQGVQYVDTAFSASAD